MSSKLEEELHFLTAHLSSSQKIAQSWLQNIKTLDSETPSLPSRPQKLGLGAKLETENQEKSVKNKSKIEQRLENQLLRTKSDAFKKSNTFTQHSNKYQQSKQSEDRGEEKSKLQMMNERQKQARPDFLNVLKAVSKKRKRK